MMSDLNPLAQAAYTLLGLRRGFDGPNPERMGAALTLVQSLVDRGDVAVQDLVQARLDKQTLELPLLEAVWRSVDLEKSNFFGGFYAAPVAEKFLALDPAFFTHAHPDGQRYLWRCLATMGAASEPIRHGLDPKVDVWAQTAIDSLPPAASSEAGLHEAWQAALTLGFSKTLGALGRRHPELWDLLDKQGAPMLRRAPADVWPQMLATGQDPHRLMPSNLPLWRTLLPKKPERFAQKHTLRSGVEAWVAEQTTLGASTPMMDGYARSVATANLSLMMRAPEAPSAEDFVQALGPWPPSWLHTSITISNKAKNEAKLPCPAWVLPFVFKSRAAAKAWDDALRSQPVWEHTIGPLLPLVRWLRQSHEPMSAEALAAAVSPEAAEIMAIWRQTKGPEGANALQAVRLQHAIDASPSETPAPRRPRF